MARLKPPAPQTPLVSSLSLKVDDPGTDGAGLEIYATRPRKCGGATRLPGWGKVRAGSATVHAAPGEGVSPCCLVTAALTRGRTRPSSDMALRSAGSTPGCDLATACSRL
jgi:hypothetical protein